MKRIALITDSTSDLPREIQEKYNIEVLPLHVIYKDAEYRDGVDITPEVLQFLSRRYPVHRCPPPGRYWNYFKGSRRRGTGMSYQYTSLAV